MAIERQVEFQAVSEHHLDKVVQERDGQILPIWGVGQGKTFRRSLLPSAQRRALGADYVLSTVDQEALF